MLTAQLILLTLAILAAAHASPTTSIPPSVPKYFCASVSTSTLATWAKSTFGGTLILPSSPRFSNATKSYFGNFDAAKPLAVAYCSSTSHVQEAVLFARAHHACVSVRASGHTTSGNAVVTGRLVIDVSWMNATSVDVDGSTASAGPGTTLQQLYMAVKPHNVFTAWGGCPGVRLGGYMQGGGQGNYGQLTGYGVDNVLEAEIVLANGAVAVANATSNADLYWALRGGGGPGGSFGVVTRYKLRVHAVPEITLVNLAASPQGGKQFVKALIMDDSFYAMGSPVVMIAGDGSVSVALPFIGSMAEAKKEVGGRFGGIAGVSIQYNTSTVYDETEGDFEYWASVAPGNGYLYETYVDQDKYSDDLYDSIVKLMASIPTPTTPFVGFILQGGAAGAPSPDATAFCHRGNSIEAVAWAFGVTEKLDEWAKWEDTARELLGAFSNGHHYQNEATLAPLDDFGSAYWCDNYPRLVEIKAKYDPDNFFNFFRSIGSDGR